jgi:hypothetical protein
MVRFGPDRTANSFPASGSKTAKIQIRGTCFGGKTPAHERQSGKHGRPWQRPQEQAGQARPPVSQCRSGNQGRPAERPQDKEQEVSGPARSCRPNTKSTIGYPVVCTWPVTNVESALSDPFMGRSRYIDPDVSGCGPLQTRRKQVKHRLAARIRPAYPRQIPIFRIVTTKSSMRVNRGPIFAEPGLEYGYQGKSRGGDRARAGQ